MFYVTGPLKSALHSGHESRRCQAFGSCRLPPHAYPPTLPYLTSTLPTIPSHRYHIRLSLQQEASSEDALAIVSCCSPRQYLTNAALPALLLPFRADLRPSFKSEEQPPKSLTANCPLLKPKRPRREVTRGQQTDGSLTAVQPPSGSNA